MKANSERVKGKNFKLFMGKPLFEWTLGNLLNVERIDAVVINTDSEDLLSRKYDILNNPKVILRERKPEIRGDFVAMNKVIEDDINCIDSDFYLMTHTTNPLISRDTFEDAIRSYSKQVLRGAYDSLFTVNKFQSRFYDKELNAINHDPRELVRTQDLPRLYEENSCIYIFDSKSFQRTNSRIGISPYLFETPRLESVDIDDHETWKLAEAFYNLIN